jgi:hypothetical protein
VARGAGRVGVGSIRANSDAQLENVPSFRRWRFEMKLSPFYSVHWQPQPLRVGTVRAGLPRPPGRSGRGQAWASIRSPSAPSRIVLVA